MLLLCARGAEPKIVYSRPPRNDTTETEVQTAEPEDGGDTNITSTTLASTLPSTGHRYADSSKSMSARTNYYGVQFYAPPVVHGTAADAFGRQLHIPPLHHHQMQRHQLQQPTIAEAAAAYYQRDRSPWEQTANVVHADGAGHQILMNPLQLQPAYDDPSTARYAPLPKPHRTQPVARIVKYAEPAAAAMAYQLPYLAAEADDRQLLDNLPALQFALQHAVGKAPPPGHLQQYAALQQPPNHHNHNHHSAKLQAPTAAATMHQVYPQSQHHLQHRHNQRLMQPHPGHHIHLQHRYAPYGAAQPATRYTQVPFLYNLQAPPTAHRHLLAPAEYDLVTRFNRLLKQRERDDRPNVQQDSTQRRRPEDGGASISGVVDDADNGEEEEEETVTRPTVKVKKTKKKRKKKPAARTTPVPVLAPAPVTEEPDEDEVDKQPPPRRRYKQLLHQDDERADDEQSNSEEQESQNVHTSEKVHTQNK